MKYHHALSAAFTSLLSAQAIAGSMGMIESAQNWTWIGTVSAGPVWARGGETQTFYLAPEIEKTYVARKSTEALASGELFVGLQKNLSSQWWGQLGLAAATTGHACLQGLIWDDADPEFDNHRYRYKVRHSRIAVQGKLLFDKNFMVLPWLSGSVGVGFNRSHDFTNTPLIFEALPNANFNNHTETTFTYTLGVGIQKTISKHWHAGLGYEFADWGKSELGRAPSQTLSSRLNLNHLYTNGAILNLTYVA